MGMIGGILKKLSQDSSAFYGFLKNLEKVLDNEVRECYH